MNFRFFRRNKGLSKHSTSSTLKHCAFAAVVSCSMLMCSHAHAEPRILIDCDTPSRTVEVPVFITYGEGAAADGNFDITSGIVATFGATATYESDQSTPVEVHTALITIPPGYQLVDLNGNWYIQSCADRNDAFELTIRFLPAGITRDYSGSMTYGSTVGLAGDIVNIGGSFGQGTSAMSVLGLQLSQNLLNVASTEHYSPSIVAVIPRAYQTSLDQILNATTSTGNSVHSELQEQLISIANLISTYKEMQKPNNFEEPSEVKWFQSFFQPRYEQYPSIIHKQFEFAGLWRRYSQTIESQKRIFATSWEAAANQNKQNDKINQKNQQCLKRKEPELVKAIQAVDKFEELLAAAIDELHKDETLARNLMPRETSTYFNLEELAAILDCLDVPTTEVTTLLSQQLFEIINYAIAQGNTAPTKDEFMACIAENDALQRHALIAQLARSAFQVIQVTHPKLATSPERVVQLLAYLGQDYKNPELHTQLLESEKKNGESAVHNTLIQHLVKLANKSPDSEEAIIDGLLEIANTHTSGRTSDTNRDSDNHERSSERDAPKPPNSHELTVSF